MTGEPPVQTMTMPDGRPVAVRHRVSTRPGAPTLMFLPGYASDMQGTKARAIDDLAGRIGCGCLRLDYSGNGESIGEFASGTLERWLDEVIEAIDRFTSGPLVLIGSSMGGWLMLLAALRRPRRIAALVGIAAAPDFTDWGLTADEKRRIERDGRLEQANPYGAEPTIIHRRFWRSSQSLLLGETIAIDCPVRLLQGDDDAEVPFAVAVGLMRRLRSSDVQLLTIKGGDHRLSKAHELSALTQTVAALTDGVQSP